MHRKTLHTAMEVSQAVGITYPFFIKIANQLKKSGLLHAVQGRSGGYQLGRPAEQISVYDVFLAVEGEMCISRCLQADHACDRSVLRLCHVRSFFSGVQESLAAQMAQQNIADLTRGACGKVRSYGQGDVSAS